MRIEDLKAELEAGVAASVDGEDWQCWLWVAARSPRYSFRNTLLIRLQRPDASVVMGYRAWQALGHQVRRGEQSISILAPCTYKTEPKMDDENDDAEPQTTRRVLRGFRVAHVFDIAHRRRRRHTSRRPHPPRRRSPPGLWEALAAQITAAGFALRREPIRSGANGTTNYITRTVTVAGRLSPAQAAKTLAHELGHVHLHDGTEYAIGCRGRAEVEAESVLRRLPGRRAGHRRLQLRLRRRLVRRRREGHHDHRRTGRDLRTPGPRRDRAPPGARHPARCRVAPLPSPPLGSRAQPDLHRRARCSRERRSAPDRQPIGQRPEPLCPGSRPAGQGFLS